MPTARIVIAGTHSGVGKTTVSLGLMAALRRRGLAVQPFKVGPDYIDPGLHAAAAGRRSINLDTWLCPGRKIKNIFAAYCTGTRVAVVEGVMGLYDGVRRRGELASTAEVSKIIKAPVILVVSARGVGRSLAAVVKGYIDFDPAVKIAGVIINQAGSQSHAELLRHAVEKELGVPVLGVLTRHQEIEMPSRHLGLVPAAEMPELSLKLDKLAEIMEEEIDIDGVLSLAAAAPPLDIEPPAGEKFIDNVEVAVAFDEAFNFYYHDSLAYLEQLGARLVYFSPLKDEKPPEQASGIIIGGGFPEVFLPGLSNNVSMRTALFNLARRGLPIYAECGGFMYLCRSISDMEGKSYPGVGLVPAEVQMKKRLSALGYVEGRLQNDCVVGARGDAVRGHEFHWSTTSGLTPEYAAYTLYGGRGKDGRFDGYARENIFCSYVHVHWRGSPQAAKNFLRACSAYANKLEEF